MDSLSEVISTNLNTTLFVSFLFLIWLFILATLLKDRWEEGRRVVNSRHHFGSRLTNSEHVGTASEGVNFIPGHFHNPNVPT
jgi:hypothetical protein